jgi:hypothetical protein
MHSRRSTGSWPRPVAGTPGVQPCCPARRRPLVGTPGVPPTTMPCATGSNGRMRRPADAGSCLARTARRRSTPGSGVVRPGGPGGPASVAGSGVARPGGPSGPASVAGSGAVRTGGPDGPPSRSLDRWAVERKIGPEFGPSFDRAAAEPTAERGFRRSDRSSDRRPTAGRLSRRPSAALDDRAGGPAARPTAGRLGWGPATRCPVQSPRGYSSRRRNDATVSPSTPTTHSPHQTR